MRTRLRSFFAPLLLAVPFAACASAFQQPEVRLDGVRLGGIGLRGGTLYARVEVANPNRFDLQAREVRYDLQIAHPSNPSDWISFAQGVIDEPMRIDSRSTHVVEVPIEFRYEDFGGAFRSILERGTFNYRVSGDVRLVQPVGRTVPYRHTGVVSMTGIR